MPANHKVSVGWQIVFTFLPIVNFWAFYRIRKLRKYVLFVVVPEIILVLYSIAFFGDIYYSVTTGVWVPLSQQEQVVTNPIVWAFQGFAIYLVIIWSRQHNRAFDTPANASAPNGVA